MSFYFINHPEFQILRGSLDTNLGQRRKKGSLRKKRWHESLKLQKWRKINAKRIFLLPKSLKCLWPKRPFIRLTWGKGGEKVSLKNNFFAFFKPEYFWYLLFDAHTRHMLRTKTDPTKDWRGKRADQFSVVDKNKIAFQHLMTSGTGLRLLWIIFTHYHF